MKHKLTLIVLILVTILGTKSFAQSNYFVLSDIGVKDSYNFSTTGTFVINATDIGVSNMLTSEQTIPFTFNFYGKPYTKYKISDNGYITFDLTQTQSIEENSTLPSPNAPKNAIFGFWDALVLQKPDNTYRYAVLNWTYGNAPNRVHVIQWFQIKKNINYTSTQTFAIRLFENGNFDVVFNYYFPGTSPTATNATVGCQNEDGTKGVMVSGSPNIQFPTNLNNGDPAGFVVYGFIFGNQAKYDIAATKVNMPNYVKMGAQLPIKGTLRTLGSENVTSVELNYSIDGGAPVTQAISGLSLTPGQYYNFTHPVNWTVPTTADSKEYKVEVWVSKINGNNDGNPENDKVFANSTALSNLVPRKSLYEVFTSSTCPPCKPGNEKLESVINPLAGKWAVVKYQYNFPGNGDPYYTSEVASRGSFYGGINSVPRLMVDGGWNNNPNSYTTDIFNQFYNAPCFVTITGNASIDPTKKSVKITGSIVSEIDINTPTRVFVAIVEKVTKKNKTSNGETEFHYVMKKLVPDVNGILVNSIKKGVPIDVNQNFTFPGSYRLPPDSKTPINLATEHSVEEFEDLTVVIWLQNPTTKEVFQSNFTETITSVDDNENMFFVNLYPNPVITSGMVQFSIDTPELVGFEIVNSLGQKVFTNRPSMLGSGTRTLEFDATTLLRGAYFMNLYIGNKVHTRTFIK